MQGHFTHWFASKAPRAKALPLIVFNTLPKSGSVFMVETLCRGLHIRFQTISAGSFPVDKIEPGKLRKAAKGHCVTQEHFDASAENLELLRCHSPRIVVHLRDPRQAMLSWIHHVVKLVNDGEARTLAYVNPRPEVAVLQRPLPAIIDWHLEHYYPHALAWMERWLEIAAVGGLPRVLITTYEKYHQNWNAMVEDILKFYAIPPAAFSAAPVPRDSSTHFRVGRADEYKEVFSREQMERAERILNSFPKTAHLYAESELSAVAS